ncbi:MAG: site-specific integrase [Planctomycetes bacterium]|nr:site-specific integrase [Planctomycetota bacterium]
MATKKATTKRKKTPGPRLPQLRVHKQSGRCYGTFNGRPVWFGHRSDPTTQSRFDAYLASWLARGRQPEPVHTHDLSIRALVARYLLHLEAKHDPSWFERNECRLNLALDALLAVYGDEPAREFSPRCLKAVRHTLIVGGRLCRGEINARVAILRKVFQWGVSEEFVPASIYHGLQSVEPLARGEFGVREGRTRGPVAEAVVFETIEHLHPVAAALVELLWWTGARPSEIFNLCPRDIDRTGEVWVAKLSHHKTSRKGKARTLDFGPQSQRILRRFLDRVPRPREDEPIFSPKNAMEEYQHRRREGRQSKVWPSHVRRYERERARRTPIEYADRYDAGTLRNAISRAVQRANKAREEGGKKPLPSWTPYQLRHAALTRIRAARGLEAAKAVGGHATTLMTEGYSALAERELARSVAAELG